MASTASSRARAAILFALLAAGGAASAALLPPERTSTLPELAVSDEHDAPHRLRALAAGAPTLLLPVFTRCSGTCPMTAVFLKDALAKAGTPLRVVVFSFDPEDTAKDLRDFRERFALPAGWLLVRSGDSAATRSFLDGLDFHFMKSEAGFDHPNQTFVFSPEGCWAATFAGPAFPQGDLESARRRALAADHPTLLQRAEDWLIRPETWILAACAGLAASLAAVVAARTHLSHRSRLRAGAGR